MNPFSLVITIFFIFIILYVTVAGFWPFIKAFGLSGLLSFWREAERLKRQIKEAIQQLPTTNIVEEQRNEFVRKYNEINDYFKKDQSIFSHSWLEFTEQLIEPSDKETVFQNSIRPEKFFTLEYFLKQKNINLKFLESMPGILVGLGVLGTFLGLSVSLIPALDKLQGDPSGAIRDLIGGAGVAFFTSVAGLFCSLIFNVISDKKTSVLQIQLNKFNSLLEKSLKFITEEHLLTMYLEESRQQGKYLSNMDENIALKIGDIIRNSFEQVGGKIQQIISQKNQNISEKFLNDIANQMTKGMGDFSRKQVENMEKTLTSLQDNIPPLISRLEHSQKQNKEATKTLINQLATSSRDNQDRINESLIHTMQNMKRAFEEITQNLKQGMTKTLSDFSEKNNVLLKQTEESKISLQKHVDQTADKLHTFTNHMDKIISELNSTTIHNIQLSVEKFNEAAKQQKQIVEKNEQYVHSLDSLSKELKEVSLSVSKFILELPGFIKHIKQSNESLNELWSNYEKRFLDVDKSAKEVFENISEGLASFSKGSAEYIKNLYNQSSHVSNNFSRVVEELQEAISELREVVNKPKE